jgi:hypothetical protein
VRGSALGQRRSSADEKADEKIVEAVVKRMGEE